MTENIPQMSAILMKRGFVIPDIECATQTSCFLVEPGENNIYEAVAESNKHMEGCYLFFSSKKEHKWIRSGSVAKRSAGGKASFGERLRQHSIAATKGESRFYRTYPSGQIEVFTLRHYACIGFKKAKYLHITIFDRASTLFCRCSQLLFLHINIIN